MNSFKTPILFIVFNRPETTEKVFQRIKQIRPNRLFVAADGPRQDKEGEFEKCMEVRKLIDQSIDWDCSIHKLYRDQNLGCGLAVSGAISWFFQNVEEGIILEDDCLPDVSFFSFCEEMLRRYRTDERMMHISGNNFQLRKGNDEGDYYFSKFAHIWGWATWRRAWKQYDFNIKKWPNLKGNHILSLIFEGSDQQIFYWEKIFDKVFMKKIDTWDYQWNLSIWANFALCILPNKNLVVNIGFGTDATHTKEKNEFISSIPLESLDKFRSPGTYNKVADNFTFNHLFLGSSLEEGNKKEGWRVFSVRLLCKKLKTLILQRKKN